MSLLWQTKIPGPSIDEKIITDQLLMAKNTWGIENDRRMMNSNEYVQHKENKVFRWVISRNQWQWSCRFFPVPDIDNNGLNVK